MYLKSITLRDWKAYETAKFEFPAPGKTKNIILIGGRNGFGKTTLFEALALGIFGRDGLHLVQRAGRAADDLGRAQSFKEFIERALFGDALAHGRNSCRIELEFVDDANEPISIERTWHFTDAGKLRPGDGGESLRVFQGVGRKVVGPGRAEQDPDGWYRDWISRTFLPTSLAAFFLFDGELASEYAERDMVQQVREGIEGLLGLNWLRTLSEDLRTYARNKRTLVPKGVSTEAITELDHAIAGMEQDLAQAQQRNQAVEMDLRDSENLRDSLTRELSGYGTGTRAQLEELIREQAEHEKQYQMAQAELVAKSEMDLPLALVGPTLLNKTEERLEAERRREQWEAATSQRDERTAQVVSHLEKQLPTIAPPLTQNQGSAVRAAVEKALEALWYPPPKDVADGFNHPYARGPMFQRIVDRLRNARGLSSGNLLSILEAMGKHAAKIREVKAEIRSTEVAAPQLDEKRAKVVELNARVGALREERGQIDNRIASRSEDLEQKKKERGRLTGKLDMSLKPVQLASRAEEVAEMLVELSTDAWPLQAESVAEEMTRAIQAMAHRNDYLSRVEIDGEGAVQLLAPDGRDLRKFDLSAGEKQIFTQALFSAIAEVSGRSFPLVIDTPLGRLDEHHRLNVLRHLASRQGQVILISTDTEVVGPFLKAIKPKITRTYLIKNELVGGTARSWAEEGYFEGQEI